MKYSRDVEHLLVIDGVLLAVVGVITGSGFAFVGAGILAILADIGVEYKVFE